MRSKGTSNRLNREVIILSVIAITIWNRAGHSREHRRRRSFRPLPASGAMRTSDAVHEQNLQSAAPVSGVVTERGSVPLGGAALLTPSSSWHPSPRQRPIIVKLGAAFVKGLLGDS